MASRRSVLAGLGVALSGTVPAAIAGRQDDPDPAPCPSSEELDQRPAGENVTEYGHLDITTHDLVVDDSGVSPDATVEGVVANTADGVVDYVEVTVRVYDGEGRHLDGHVTNTTDLAGGTEWVFDVSVLAEPADIDSYDIAVTDSPGGA